MDGHTYEHDAIRKWLLGGRLSSPVTNDPLQSALLVPNHALRPLCERMNHKGFTAECERLDPRMVERLCARVSSLESVSLQRWVRDMDGDSPEDVARMLVQSSPTEGGPTQLTVLLTLSKVAALSRRAIVSSGGLSMALAILEQPSGNPSLRSAATAVVASAGPAGRGGRSAIP